MAFWNNKEEIGTKKDFSNKEVGTLDKANLLELFTATTNLNADIPITADIDSSKTLNQKTDSRAYNQISTYNPIDARSLIVITNSSDSSVTKKDDLSQSLSSKFNPSTTIPTDFGTTTSPLDVSPKLALETGLGTIGLIGGTIALAGLWIYSKKVPNAKKRS